MTLCSERRTLNEQKITERCRCGGTGSRFDGVQHEYRGQRPSDKLSEPRCGTFFVKFKHKFCFKLKHKFKLKFKYKYIVKLVIELVSIDVGGLFTKAGDAERV
ncbi:MAG: hypothetical protein NC401_03135 [Ruminococcus sp.]|nr:hypothetical protein [Ruminococcus sp.]